MDDRISFRQATIDDIPLLLFFIRKIAEYEKLSGEVSATEEILKETLFEKNLPIEAVFAIIDDQEVGAAIYYHNFSTFTGKPGLYLEDLFVIQEYRNQGVGRALMNYCIDLAKSRGCGRMEWSALKWNPACHFYERVFDATPLNEWVTYRLKL